MPGDWAVKLTRQKSRPSALLQLTSPGGERVTFVVETKRSLTALTLVAALDQLNASVDAWDSEALPLLVAGYLSPRSQEVLISWGVSYVDSTGNLRLSAIRPGLFISTAGATRDPWPDDQPLRSLKCRGASRAMRALLGFRPPFGVRELASRAQVSPATLSRVIDLLERDGVLPRTLVEASRISTGPRPFGGGARTTSCADPTPSRPTSTRVARRRLRESSAARSGGRFDLTRR